MARLVVAHTVLPKETLLFRSMNGEEGLSSLFVYNIELLSEDGNIELTVLLSQPISLEVIQVGYPTRWFHGEISSISLIGKEGGSSRYYVYQLEVRPKLWYLTQGTDCRIYQEKTVPEIIKDVLNDFNVEFEDKLTNSYRIWEYCVQYQETEFNFISRLMEHEGIYYYFEHEKERHKMILVDSPDLHQTMPGFPFIPYRGPNASAVVVDEVCINEWRVSGFVTPQLFSMDEYDFRKPYATLLDAKNNPKSYSTTRTEVFEWPGHYIDRQDAEGYVKVRQQEGASQHQLMQGTATTSSIAPGFKFLLIEAPRLVDNQEYLIVRANYTIWDNTFASGDDSDRGQLVSFSSLPASIHWRPQRTSYWPRTYGPQTARVVCPAGETIWTDKYGRVKVKFRWDRYNAEDDGKTSCWVRVATNWASQGYGAIHIPRLNDEVIIDFMNGDPDRPIIIGQVFNDANMPPWDLPANATQTGTFTRSKTGYKETANAFRFEDKRGAEQVWLHAERDMDTEVENNQTLLVGKNRSLNVLLSEDTTIGINRIEAVGINETAIVGINRCHTVGINDSLTVGAAREVTVGGIHATTVGGAETHSIGGAYSLAVGGASSMVVGAAATFVATAAMVFSCGASSIIMDAGGNIIISGVNIKIAGASSVDVDGGQVTIN